MVLKELQVLKEMKHIGVSRSVTGSCTWPPGDALRNLHVNQTGIRHVLGCGLLGTLLTYHLIKWNACTLNKTAAQRTCMGKIKGYFCKPGKYWNKIPMAAFHFFPFLFSSWSLSICGPSGHRMSIFISETWHFLYLPLCVWWRIVLTGNFFLIYFIWALWPSDKMELFQQHCRHRQCIDQRRYVGGCTVVLWWHTGKGCERLLGNCMGEEVSLLFSFSHFIIHQTGFWVTLGSFPSFKRMCLKPQELKLPKSPWNFKHNFKTLKGM